MHRRLQEWRNHSTDREHQGRWMGIEWLGLEIGTYVDRKLMGGQWLGGMKDMEMTVTRSTLGDIYAMYLVVPPAQLYVIMGPLPLSLLIFFFLFFFPNKVRTCLLIITLMKLWYINIYIYILITSVFSKTPHYLHSIKENKKLQKWYIYTHQPHI